MFFRILQWKLNDSYLLSTIKMSQPRSKMSFSRVSRVDFWTEKSRGRKPLMSAIYLLFLPYSLGCLSLLLVWQEGNVEGLTSVILQLNPTLGCVCTVCVCVCPETAPRLVTQSLSCYFFTIILVITLLYFSLLSESIFLMFLFWLSWPFSMLQLSSSHPSLHPTFPLIICLHEDLFYSLGG